MLYGSKAFSATSQPIYLRNDGERLTQGQWPSQADVFGIKTIYQALRSPGADADPAQR